MSDIVERLLDPCQDWDGSEMADAAETLSTIDCGTMREAAATILSLRALLDEAQGYVAGNHDEGCELDPEYGRMNFEMKNEDNEDAIWPDEAKCDCGSDDLSTRIVAALAKEPTP